VQFVLLTEGRVAFVGTAAEGLGYFASNGNICPLHSNPADFFVRTVNIAGPSAYVKFKVSAVGSTKN
jgi:hypothetical protein